MFSTIAKLFLLNFVLLSNISAEAEITPLTKESVSEGPCIIPYPKPSLVSIQFFVETIMRRNAPFYMPMGSEHLYRSYATYLLGRPPSSKKELNSMNLRIKGSLTHYWHSTGYNRSFDQACIFEGHLIRANCVATQGSPGTDLTHIRQTTDTMVYTDNKSVYLFIRCVLGKENDWKLLSINPTVEETVKVKVLEKVMELGFTNSSYWEITTYA